MSKWKDGVVLRTAPGAKKIKKRRAHPSWLARAWYVVVELPKKTVVWDRKYIIANSLWLPNDVGSCSTWWGVWNSFTYVWKCFTLPLEVGIDNPETDDSYINILAIGTLDKEIFLDMFAEFRQVTMEVKSYQKNYSKKMEILLGSFIETWLESNEREEFYESPYREFLAK